MAKNDNLKDFLTDVADAIREKKGTTDTINPQDFSSEIASIQSGKGIDFSVLGYRDNEYSQIQSFINYSIEQATKLNNGEIIDFKKDIKLIFAPHADTSKLVNAGFLFYYDSSLLIVPSLDLSNATVIRSLCADCSRLISVGVLSTPKAYDTRTVFSNCSLLERVLGIDLSSSTSSGNIFFGCSNLSYIVIYNIGKSSLTTFDFSGATVWGTGGEENRQSLIDSLITYSYDRASAGMATATIKLSANSKALLTEEEIAQITAKGFSLA